MIKDKIVNAKTYYGLSKRIERAFTWLKDCDLKNLEEGRHEIDDAIYANVQVYETKEDSIYEAHRKYIDIQCVISGKEKVEVAYYNECKTKTEYDSDKDVEFLTADKNESVSLTEGEFLILYPQDVHKPCLNFDKSGIVKKIVVKVGI